MANVIKIKRGAGAPTTNAQLAPGEIGFNTTDDSLYMNKGTDTTPDIVRVGEDANSILTKIKTVDGASSGLDADLLDGKHASAFALTDHTHSNVPLVGSIYNATSGVLIDICEDTLYNMVTVQVAGNGYNGKPILSIFQAYHYDTLGNFIQAKQLNLGEPLPAGKFLIHGGRLKLWFSQSTTYQTFVVTAYSMGGKIEKPTVTNASEPSTTYKVTCAIQPQPADWASITGKPSTFTPSAHDQDWSTINSKPAQATRWPAWSEVTSKPAQATRWPAWSEVTSKPSTFAPSTHTHTIGTKSGNGYAKLDNGVIIAWGTASVPANSTAGYTVSFPISFTAAPKVMVNCSSHAYVSSIASSATTTNFKVYSFDAMANNYATATTIEFIAVGY